MTGEGGTSVPAPGMGCEGLVLCSNPYTTSLLGMGDILSLLLSSHTLATERTSPLRVDHLQVDLILLELRN